MIDYRDHAHPTTMFVMQAITFAPWFKPDTTRWLIAPARSVCAAGLFLVPWASDFKLMLVVIGAVAASAGILSPILTYWISAKAGSAQGWELGKQTAAFVLGQPWDRLRMESSTALSFSLVPISS